MSYKTQDYIKQNKRISLIKQRISRDQLEHII